MGFLRPKHSNSPRGLPPQDFGPLGGPWGAGKKYAPHHIEVYARKVGHNPKAAKDLTRIEKLHVRKI